MRHERHARPTLPGLLGLTLAVALLSAPAGADSIYLKNGRVIHTPSATVDGDRVVFLQYGHPMGIPMAQVERIEENDLSGPEASAPREPAPTGSTSAQASTGTPARTSSGPESPEQTKEYWQDRVRAINAEAQALDLELKQLRRIERAFLFSRRSTADTRRQIESVQARIDANERAMPELRREARREGIPAGWLRLPSGG